jgi:hypothetical protein
LDLEVNPMPTSPTRSLVGIIGIAGAGALIWFAGRFDGATSRDYWISLGLVAAAGLAFGASQRLRVALPAAAPILVAALVVAIWVGLSGQPTGGHVHTWSRDLGIGGVVARLAAHVGVLTFATAALLAAAAGALPRPRPLPVREEEVAPTDEPVLEDSDAELTAAR